ncbi:MAG TPA: hypothetical protein VFH07_16545 [Chitinophagaceae bacterium]|nr:hypothetical protein [Chitinophagaceae bacterium]
MKKFVIPLIFAVPVHTCAQDSLSKKEYKLLAGLSVLGGVQNTKHFDAWAPVYGVEFSMECPLIQTGKSHVRQQLSLMRQDGKDHKSLTVEVNPQYKIIASPSFELGVGPVAGFIFTSIRDNNKPVFDYGLGTGAVYYSKRVFIGFESRYTMTKEILFDDIDKEPGQTESGNLNNLRIFLKIGCKL